MRAAPHLVQLSKDARIFKNSSEYKVVRSIVNLSTGDNISAERLLISCIASNN